MIEAVIILKDGSKLEMTFESFAAVGLWIDEHFIEYETVTATKKGQIKNAGSDCL